MDEFKKFLLCVGLTVAIAFIAVCVVLAFLYSVYFALGLAGIAFLAATRWLILPIVQHSLEIGKKLHTYRIEASRSYALLSPDANGNYPVAISASGEIIQYIQPGNAPFKIAAKDRTVGTTVTEVNDPRQITGPSLDPARVVAPSLIEELESGVLDPGQDFTFGYRVATDPYTKITTLEPITDTHTRTLFLAGWSGTGKSTLVACSMARRARTQRNVAFLVLDPHKGAEEDSLAVQIAPAFNDWLIQPKGGEKITGKKPSEVRAVVQFLKQEVELRLDRPDLTPEQKRQISPYYGLDIWVIVDEVLSYARETRMSKHDPAFDDLMFLLQTIATDTRKVGITGIYMTQLSTKEQLGEIEIKDACPKRIILQAPKDQGKALGLTGPEANIAERFAQGRGFYMSKTGMEIFVWGYGSPRDITEALAGVESPLTRKQDGNKILALPSRTTAERGWKEDGNEYGNGFPSALQARLDEIDDWQGKLEKMEALGPYAEKSDIWQVVFGHAPGGRSYQKEASIFSALVEASRHNHQRKEA